MKRLLLFGVVCGVMAVTGGMATYCWNTRWQAVENQPVIANHPTIRASGHVRSAIPEPQPASDVFPENTKEQVQALVGRFRSDDAPTASATRLRRSETEADVRFAQGPRFDTDPPRPDFAEPVYANPIRTVEERSESLRFEPQRVDQPQELEVLDLSEGMTYVLRVHPQHEDTLSSRLQSVRVHAGKMVAITEFAVEAKVPALTIYAESVDIDEKSNELSLQCEGRVTVVANQSMLRGKDLSYFDGRFTMKSMEISTADATIESGESTFAFALGSISIERLQEEVATETGEGDVAPEAVPSKTDTARFTTY